MIDLRSDTFTKPTAEMLDAMFRAEVGDDVFYEDPTINALQEKAANMFGMEAALFCPSGTMTNQIALAVHCEPGDEIICHRLSHIYNYEGGGIMATAGASVRLLEGHNGLIQPEDIEANINPEDDHYTVSKVLEIENTVNKGGGVIYTLDHIKRLHGEAQKHGLLYHLDGARVFNALVETGDDPKAYGKYFDSISICLSKGLGAPVGSLLLGSEAFIKKAHRRRKMMGGGMRQAGYLAAAGIYALDHHVERLKTDHAHAKKIGDVLAELPYVAHVIPPQTNILIFELGPGTDASAFIEKLDEKGIKAINFSKKMVRFVTHLDVTENMVDEVCETLKTLKL